MDREFYGVMGDVMSFEFSNTNPPAPSHPLHSILVPPFFHVERVEIVHCITCWQFAGRMFVLSVGCVSYVTEARLRHSLIRPGIVGVNLLWLKRFSRSYNPSRLFLSSLFSHHKSVWHISLKMTAFWDTAPCSLVEVGFIGAYCIIRAMMGTVLSSETSVYFNENTSLYPRRLSSSDSPPWELKSDKLHRSAVEKLFLKFPLSFIDFCVLN
jgi:hypothetical protein